MEQGISVEQGILHAEADHVPLLRPKLPDLAELTPYLTRIDQNRFYTNYGPLSEELRTRVADGFGIDSESLVLASSGTAALCAAILAVGADRSDDRGVALVPSYTFPATALAAELCGYRPVVVDVDRDTWGLDPDRVRDEIAHHDARLVVVVAPMGRFLDQAPWIELRNSTDVPVVIDAASSFENIEADPGRSLGPLPTAISFHATKSFTTAEGGCVVVDDDGLADRVDRALNFGFGDDRVTEATGLNGKLSEYHAAIGHASLDVWRQRRDDVLAVGARYLERFAEAGIPGRLWATPTVGSSHVLYEAPTTERADVVRRHLNDSRIGTRGWYSPGLHRQAHFMSRSSGSYPVTDDLAGRFLGLPAAPDLQTHQIERVISCLRGAPS